MAEDLFGSVVVRPYEAGDLGACLAVFDTNVPEYFVPAERAGFEQFLHALPGPYLVLVSGDRVVGCGGYAMAEDDHTADLCWGMVRHELHGRGLGRRLLAARIERALRDPRVDALALNTSQHTTGFYERAGFVIERVVTDGYAPGLDRCDMRLVLTPD